MFETKRTLMASAIAALCLAAVPAAAEPKHGLSVFGELKYPANFTHFDYVNPDAPKGGRITFIGPAAIRTFDSFNQFILKGDAAQGLGLLYDTMMEASGDEAGSVYGLLAETADLAPDGMSITYKLRSEARFSDGSPVTADDAVFTLDALKTKGHPSYRIQLRDVIKAEALDKQTVRYTFQGNLVRDLPLMVGALPVLPRAYYATQPFDETTLKTPVGSGAYTIGDFKQSGHITYKRRPDYWGAGLPVNRGRYNFEEIRYEYYLDRTLELEALKAGGIDLREEFTARDWTTAYDIPAVRDGRLIKLTLPDETPSGAQAFFFNTRRTKFQDPRVRQALAEMFDFEELNASTFNSLYTRTESFFENSDMKATGKPSPAEVALLEPYRAKLPPDVFGEAYVPPKTDGSGRDRRPRLAALKRLAEAGWKLDTNAKPQAMRNAAGETLEIEFLNSGGPTFERILNPYIGNLVSIGIKASIRNVDGAQYQRRAKAYDFDVIGTRFTMQLIPGIELLNYWGSEAASMEGSANQAGIKDPVIDELIGKVAIAKSREELVTATRAIDRVLRAGHYWVPNWYKAAHHVVYWDKFGRPAVKPKYTRGIIDTWWYDEARAAKLSNPK